jgi:hypothetical protein
MAEFNPNEYLSGFNPDEYLNYDELNKEKSKADILREQLRAEPWLQRNIKGAMTAPSNLLEGVKQGAYELTHAKNPLDVTTRGIPQKGYDTSKISENRIIASEAPLGALAGNVATYAPLAFAPGAQSATGAALYGAGAGLMQPTVGEESRASNAVTGALLGGATPVASATKGKLANALLNKSEDLVYSALKPTQSAYKSGAAKDAVDTILNTKGLYPSKGGIEKLDLMISDLNDQISSKIGSSTEKVELQGVVDKLNGLKDKFLYQVNNEADKAAIDSSRKQFLTHELFQKTTEEGAPYTTTEIPVQLAQKMKQATYRSLGDKAYGEIGGAARESQKALARGLKEGVASKVENINELNAAEGKLINAQDVIERAANRHSNKEMGGLAYLMHPMQALAYLVDRNPSSKVALAKALYALSKNKVPPGVVKGTQAATYAAIPELTQGE